MVAHEENSIFMWLLYEDLHELHGIDIDYTELDEVLCALSSILPLSDCVAAYIKWKNKIDFDRIQAGLLALGLPLAKYPKRIGHEVSDESMIERLEFGKGSIYCMGLAAKSAQGVVYMALLDMPELVGVIMRIVLELWLKGLLIEHLRHRRFRVQVENSYYTNYASRRKDSVAKLLISLLRKAHGTINDEQIGMAMIATNTQVFMRDVIYWLRRWEVLPKSLNLLSTWKKLCGEVHGDILKIMQRILLHDKALNIIAEDFLQLIDICLLALFNTINNCCKHKLHKVDNNTWRILLRCVDKGELKYTRQKLHELGYYKRS